MGWKDPSVTVVSTLFVLFTPNSAALFLESDYFRNSEHDKIKDGWL